MTITLQEAQRVADAIIAVDRNAYALFDELTIAFPQFVWRIGSFDRSYITRSSLTEEEVQTELENLPTRYGCWRNV